MIKIKRNKGKLKYIDKNGISFQSGLKKFCAFLRKRFEKVFYFQVLILAKQDYVYLCVRPSEGGVKR